MKEENKEERGGRQREGEGRAAVSTAQCGPLVKDEATAGAARQSSSLAVFIKNMKALFLFCVFIMGYQHFSSTLQGSIFFPAGWLIFEGAGGADNL